MEYQTSTAACSMFLTAHMSLLSRIAKVVSGRNMRKTRSPD